MSNPEAILQLARLLGRAEFLRRLELQSGEEPVSIDSDQLDRIHSMVSERLETLTAALLEEAMANDDVLSAPAASAYLQDRLRFLDDLLTPAQREDIRARFEASVASWG